MKYLLIDRVSTVIHESVVVLGQVENIADALALREHIRFQNEQVDNPIGTPSRFQIVAIIE